MTVPLIYQKALMINELVKHGFTIIRFKEGEVLNNINDVCDINYVYPSYEWYKLY